MIKHILHIIPSTTVKWGGPVTTLSNLVEVWNLEHIKSQVLTINSNADCIKVDTKVFAFTPSFPSRYSNSRQALVWLKENARKYDLAIIHAIWSIINIRSALVLNTAGVRYCVIPHGSLDPFDLQKKAWLKKLLGPLIIRRYLDKSSGIICSTDLEADRLITYGSTTKKYSIPWPVIPDVHKIDRESVRAKYNIEESEFVVLFLGRIDYKKGFPILLPAFEKFAKCREKTRLLIVGPDSRNYTATVRNIIRDLNIENNVTILKPVTGREKSELLQIADCFALPSLNENFGNAVVEAMQHGLPVIISKNVYIYKEVEAVAAGYVCDYNVEGVFTALKNLYDNVCDRVRMSANAQKLGLSYSPKNLVSVYANLLEGIRKN